MLSKLKYLSLYYGFHIKKRFRPIPATRPSATILIVRDSPDGLEVFMVVRHHQIDFASGALVFPGGKVDKRDRAPELRAYCDGVDGIDDETLALQVAAIREVYEESGFLLARKNGDDTLFNAEQLKSLESYRDAFNNRQMDMLTFVSNENLRLACDQLHHFSHWVTPEMLPKRFDTHFYLVHAPTDQVGLHDGHESVDSVWITPQAALRDQKAGKRTIVFPTRVNLKQLGKSKTAQEAVDHLKTATVYRVMPTMKRKGLDIFLTVPEEAGYGKIEIPLAHLP